MRGLNAMNDAEGGRKTRREQETRESDEAACPTTDMPLDPGIRRYVLALRAGGIDTFESCEGGAGHAMPEPTIRFTGGMGEGFKALAVAKERGLPVLSFRLSYAMNDGFPTGPHWEMVFSHADRAD